MATEREKTAMAEAAKYGIGPFSVVAFRRPEDKDWADTINRLLVGRR